MDPLFSLKGKSILIVGASSGIGRQATKLYAERGASLLLAARRKELLDKFASEIGAKSYFVDATKSRSVEKMVSQVERIDVVLCTPGINIRKPAMEHTEEDWDHLMEINLKGTWLVNQAVIRHMVDRKIRGTVINLSSVLGSFTAQGSALYATSKAAIEQMTRSFALETAKYGIRVNALAPGYIETDLNREYLQNVAGKAIVERAPTGRLGKLDDLSGALLFLASDASLYMTGTILPVDGGFSARRLF
ncbi:MAG: SDR family oxidoreductase [Verrucomicrobia bacterium]|nr:SDR family oxidoreductase [Verrucomicrobiota bacterium]